MPTKSKLMDELYGPQGADTVYNRLQQLDPEFNEIIQRVAYDHFWARPGLSIRDKSLVTVTSLIALGKQEQIKIHINGFLNANGTIAELKAMMAQLAMFVSSDTARNCLLILEEVLLQRTAVELDVKFDGLSLRDTNLIHVAASVAVGNQHGMREAIRQYLNDGHPLTDLKNAFIHQIVYCGFPAAMNAFAALQDVNS